MTHVPQSFQKLVICVFYQNRFLLLYKLSLLVLVFCTVVVSLLPLYLI